MPHRRSRQLSLTVEEACRDPRRSNRHRRISDMIDYDDLMPRREPMRSSYDDEEDDDMMKYVIMAVVGAIILILGCTFVFFALRRKGQQAQPGPRPGQATGPTAVLPGQPGQPGQTGPQAQLPGLPQGPPSPGLQPLANQQTQTFNLRLRKSKSKWKIWSIYNWHDDTIVVHLSTPDLNSSQIVKFHSTEHDLDFLIMNIDSVREGTDLENQKNDEPTQVKLKVTDMDGERSNGHADRWLEIKFDDYGSPAHQFLQLCARMKVNSTGGWLQTDARFKPQTSADIIGQPTPGTNNTSDTNDEDDDGDNDDTVANKPKKDEGLGKLVIGEISGLKGEWDGAVKTNRNWTLLFACFTHGYLWIWRHSILSRLIPHFIRSGFYILDESWYFWNTTNDGVWSITGFLWFLLKDVVFFGGFYTLILYAFWRIYRLIGGEDIKKK